MDPSLLLWIGFNVFILAMLALDLGVFHRRAHALGVREAALWSAFWIVLALAFGAGVHHFIGAPAGLEFFTGYLIEKALSVDNLFVFVLIFSYFSIPRQYQHRVLFWGILGALVMRGAMIGAGALLLQSYHWVVYVFGGFLVVTGLRMSLQKQLTIEPEANPVLRLLRRVVPVSTAEHGPRFFIREGTGAAARWAATPLLVVLVLVETTDLVFAVDSIPAVFAVTREPFLVYTSNVFAILGLRSLYFLLAEVVHRFHHLKLGLSVVLVFVGAKMLTAEVLEIPVGWSLAFVAAVLAISIVTSLLFPRRPPGPTPAGVGDESGARGEADDAVVGAPASSDPF